MSDNFNIQAFVQKTRNADLKALQEGYDKVREEASNTHGISDEKLHKIAKALNTTIEDVKMNYLGLGEEMKHDKMSEEMKDVEMEEEMKHDKMSEEMKDAKMKEGENYYEDSMYEAEEETEDVFAMEEPDGEEAIEVEDTAEMETPAASTDSKEIFSKLVDAYEAAKALGDEKLTRQLANTITYFNKSVIFGDTK